MHEVFLNSPAGDLSVSSMVLHPLGERSCCSDLLLQAGGSLPHRPVICVENKQTKTNNRDELTRAVFAEFLFFSLKPDGAEDEDAGGGGGQSVEHQPAKQEEEDCLFFAPAPPAVRMTHFSTTTPHTAEPFSQDPCSLRSRSHQV